MVAERLPYVTPEEYLAREHEAEHKSEYVDGVIYAMARGSPGHDRIAMNVGSEFRAHLKGRPCEAFSSNMRVRVNDQGLYTYPDVTVACGDARFDDVHGDTLLNPTVIVEILSPSTEAWDRGGKAERYRQLESLREYLLITQDRPHVERYARSEAGSWTLREVSGLDGSIRIESIALDLALAEVYDRVEFGDVPSAAARAESGEGA